MKIRLPDIAYVFGENNAILYSSNSTEASCVKLSIGIENDILTPTVAGGDVPLCYVVLKWLFKDEEKRKESVKIFGDAWERGYGDLEWRGISPERHMPWYCLVSNGSDRIEDTKGRYTEGFGVKVRPASFCSWQYDASGVTLHIDIRCGTKGVILGSRELELCRIIFGNFYDMSAFCASRKFCAEMCDDPRFPKESVYGFNNWYYAYGISSEERILADTDCLMENAHGLGRPYMVIDDCWQINRCDGPWHMGNAKFPDMRALAAKIKEKGAAPGIWVRPLRQKAPSDIPDEWRSKLNPEYLDPSRDEVLDYIDDIFSRIVDWGYELIKFDFITNDVYEKWGKDAPRFLANGQRQWSFYDRSKTGAEIILNMYRRIRRASRDAVLIGCNAIGHLCAGIVEINRTGDDTSGRDWQRTRVMGVNTLAFRAMQNKTFYLSDADCAAITKNVPWQLNQKWLRLLAASGSPLFISWDTEVSGENITDAVKGALQVNSIQKDELIPLDWMENTCPSEWLLNGQRISVDWFESFTDNIIKPL